MKYKLIVLLFVCSFFNIDVFAQIPVEVFVGNQKTSVDILFFKYFKNNRSQNSKFLFFDRNRATIDYRQTSTTFLPILSFIEAVSYNHPKLKGFAPVVVAQILNNGISPKSGIQYFYRKPNFTFFSWVVSETIKNPSFDFFVLTRYEPKITNSLNLFTQLELLNSFPSLLTGSYSFTQRFRVGLKAKSWQSGIGGDFNEFGNIIFTSTNNIGVFLRHEF